MGYFFSQNRFNQIDLIGVGIVGAAWSNGYLLIGFLTLVAGIAISAWAEKKFGT